jgi:RNA polymerase sigma-70 factor (ECF subfamily)
MNDVKEFIPTRQSLLCRLKDLDNQASWQEFFDTYWRLIYNTAIRAGLNEAEAEDVVQETIISVAKSMPDFNYDPKIGSFKRWLLNLTNWRIMDRFRERQPGILHRSYPHSDTETSTVDRLPDTEDRLKAVWDEEWERHVVETATEKVKKEIDDKHFQAFDLYVNEKWPVSKVAESLNLRVAQIYLIKHRVSNKIRREIIAIERKNNP